MNAKKVLHIIHNDVFRLEIILEDWDFFMHTTFDESIWQAPMDALKNYMAEAICAVENTTMAATYGRFNERFPQHCLGILKHIQIKLYDGYLHAFLDGALNRPFDEEIIETLKEQGLEVHK